MSLPAANTRELDLLHRIGQVIGYDLSLSEVLQIIVNVTADLMTSKVVSILLFDEQAKTLSIAATQSLSPAYKDKGTVPLERSVSGRAILSKTPQVIPDVQKEETYGFKAVASAEGIVAMLCTPMLIRGQAIGVINSYSSSPRDYSEEDIKLLSLVAAQSAIAIENARLHVATAAFQAEVEARKVIGQAKAMLMKKRGLDEPAAHRFLQKESMNRRKAMKEIAEALLLSDDITDPKAA